MNFNARLARIEAALPAPRKPDPFEGRDDVVRSMLAKFFLVGAERASEAGDDARVGGSKTYKALFERLRAEDLDWGPLGELGRDRVREIAAELEQEAG